MIIDQMSNLSKYEAMHPRFPAAFAFLRELLESGAADGKHVLAGTDVENAIYVNIATGDVLPKEAVVAESHDKYIDIQVVLTNEELMCVPSFEIPTPNTPYNEVKDCYKYTPVPFDTCHSLKMGVGSFVIFFEKELHAPSMSLTNEPVSVRKAVVKVLA